MQPTYWINTDNALGSSRGDIDDAYALILSRELNLNLVIASYGNTSVDQSYINTSELFKTIKSPTRVVRGASGPRLPAALNEAVSSSTVYIDLGPLTQLAHLISGQSTQVFQRVVLVGGRPDSRGFLYPYWPHEFNFSHDASATRAVFESRENIYLVGLNQARRLVFDRTELNILRTAWPWLAQASESRFLRNFFLKGQSIAILWDVVAIASELFPDYFSWAEQSVTCDTAGRIRKSQSGRKIQLLVDFDVDAIRKIMIDSILSSPPCRELAEKIKSLELTE